MPIRIIEERRKMYNFQSCFVKWAEFEPRNFQRTPENAETSVLLGLSELRTATLGDSTLYTRVRHKFSNGSLCVAAKFPNHNNVYIVVIAVLFKLLPSSESLDQNEKLQLSLNYRKLRIDFLQILSYLFDLYSLSPILVHTLSNHVQYSLS